MNSEIKVTQTYKPSQYEEDLDPEKAIIARLLAGSLDILILLALKNIINIFSYKFELLVIPAYYLFCLVRNSTTVGGIIFGIKIVEKSSKRTNINVKHSLIRSLVVSSVTALTYYSFIKLDGMYHYIIPAMIVIVYVNPIFFTKNRLTLHDYASFSKVIKFKIKSKTLLKRAVLILFSSILVVASFFLLDSKCKQSVEDKDFAGESALITQLCASTTHANYSEDEYYKLGISFLKKRKGRTATRFLEKAALAGNKKANILLIQSYAMSNKFGKAEKQAKKLIKDLAAPLIMSNMFMQRYERNNDPKYIYKAYIYLNLYYLSYSNISVRNSAMSWSEQKDLLKDYYPVAKKYIALAEETLSVEKIQEAQSEGMSILFGIN